MNKHSFNLAPHHDNEEKHKNDGHDHSTHQHHHGENAAHGENSAHGDHSGHHHHTSGMFVCIHSNFIYSLSRLFKAIEFMMR